MEPFETFEHAGCTIALYQDVDPTPPSDWDTLGTLYAFRADYVGMEKASGNAREMMERRGVRGMLRYLSLFEGLAAIPFDVFEHSSVTISETSVQDDDCYGYIAADASSIAMTGVPVDKIAEGLRAELDTWRAYFEGNVVGYVVHAGVFPMPDDGIIVYGEQERYLDSAPVIDSCWGFYPDDDGDGFEYVREEARQIAEHEARERAASEHVGIPTKEA